MNYIVRAGVFVAAPDRGPFDGRTDVPYRDRVHYMHFAIDLSAPPSINAPNIRATLLDTVLLKKTGTRISLAALRTSWRDSIPMARPSVAIAASSSPTSTGRPTQIFAFAIGAAVAGINLVPQQVGRPMFPPGQVNKALKQQ
jgi:hypothetical protein